MKKAAIYRRRRLGALAAAAFAASFLWAVAADADPARRAYTVAPGDTLWEIATEHYPPAEDPRMKVEEIRRHNGLEGYAVQPGTRLLLPE
ncbi:MAG: LysM peptidoglycan-binding domain-containing protein [Actinomycetota bacterium]